MRCLPLFLLLLLLSPAYAASAPKVRVAVIENAQTVSIDLPSGSARITIDSGREHTLNAKNLTITADQRALRMNRGTANNEILIQTRDNRFVVGKRSFGGTLRIVRNAHGKLIVINTLPVEEYLIGLLGSEMASSWPMEALKAQAVAARSYTLSRLQRERRAKIPAPFDMRATMLDQVYHGTHLDDHRTTEAVASTHGQILARGGRPIVAYYHSCCGGQTELAHHVWSESQGPPAVFDTFCAASPKLTWRYELPLTELTATLNRNGIVVQGITALSAEPYADSPRAERVLITGRTGVVQVRTTDLRRMVGYGNVKSTWFNVGIEHGRAVFAGRGYGHGVGLCQWGAKGMAEVGKSYRDILQFYYPDADIVTLY